MTALEVRPTDIFAFGDEVGEIEVYSSLDSAAMAMEPWQIAHTLAVDGCARRVRLIIEGPRVLAFSTDEDVDEEALKKRVSLELAKLGKEPLSASDLLALLRQLADALGYAD